MASRTGNRRSRRGFARSGNPAYAREELRPPALSSRGVFVYRVELRHLVLKEERGPDALEKCRAYAREVAEIHGRRSVKLCRCLWKEGGDRSPAGLEYLDEATY